MQFISAGKYLGDHRSRQDIPITASGRALYTIDWFVNGRPGFNDHDGMVASKNLLSQLIQNF